VVLRRDAYKNLRLATEATAAVAPGRMEIIEPYTLAGRARYGRVLTVEPGAVTPSDAVAHYTWLRGGTPIAGADGPSYRLGAADVGREVSVRLVFRRDGYRSKAVVLPATGIVTTRPKLHVEAQGGVRKLVVKLRVTAPGVEHPAGHVTVKVAGREVTGAVRDGRLRLVVRGIDPGRHRVRIAYLGTKRIEARSVVTDPVKVRRR
jgi:hypothetical protein